MSQMRLSRFAQVAIGLLLFLAVSMIWYDWKYSMDVVPKRSINDPTSDVRLLLATQGSAYKNELIARLTEAVDRNVYIEIVDVTHLSEVEIEQYDLCVIIHTWEMWKPPKDVRAFISKAKVAEMSFVIGTSGSGDLSIDGLDGISSASRLADLPSEVEFVMDWINTRLSQMDRIKK